MRTNSMTIAACGSAKSDWVTAVSNSNATADSSSVLLNPTASTAATALPIPEGCTRILLRQRVSASGTTVGTLAIVIPIAVDKNGVPTRLDSGTLGAAGLTMPLDSTLASNYLGANMAAFERPGSDTSAYRYGVPVSLTPMDCLGGQWLYVLRSTASNHTGGASNPTIEVLFLN